MMGNKGGSAKMGGKTWKSFDVVEQGPPDPILGIKTAYLKDKSPEAVNVSVGAYRDADGKPYVLNVVKKAEAMILNNDKRVKEYLGIAGDPKFIEATRKFCFGPDAQSIKDERVATVQALSGTGALRVGAEFIATHFPGTLVAIPNPTWGNHFKIFKNAGLPTTTYTYWDPKNKGVGFDGLLEDVKKLPTGSVLLLQACSHNPSGCDLTKAQWQEVLDIAKSKQLLPFFDTAYQGFASGDVDEDAYAIRLFEDSGIEMMVAQSYSKNMGLYGERVGACSVVCSSKETATRVKSQLELVVRPMYSNPPRHGAAIAALVLTEPDLYAEFLVELKGMTDRIKLMREKLRKAVEATGAPGDHSYITSQIGMFAFTGLNKEQVEEIEKNFHVYMPRNGRISIAGLTDDKIEHVAKAIRSVL